MRLSLGITGVILYVLFDFLQFYLNSPFWNGILFILSIIPVTLMAFLFVDNLNELKEPKKFASFVTFLIILILSGSIYHGTASSKTVIELILFAVFVWALAFFSPKETPSNVSSSRKRR